MPAPIVAGIVGLGRLAISAAPKAYRGIKAYRNARKLKKLQSQAARREAAQKSSRAARNADKSKFSKDKPKCTKNCKPKAGRESLNDAQLKNLKRYEKKLPKGAEPTQITNAPNGGKVFSSKVPGRVPGSSATYRKTVDALGKTTDYIKTTVDPAGKVIHVKPKF
jgi:hypothetical protein